MMDAPAPLHCSSGSNEFRPGRPVPMTTRTTLQGRGDEDTHGTVHRTETCALERSCKLTRYNCELVGSCTPTKRAQSTKGTVVVRMQIETNEHVKTTRDVHRPTKHIDKVELSIV
jgi:hypothetical protein